MKEVWKDIDGYIGKYQISNFGRVVRGERRKASWTHTNIIIWPNGTAQMLNMVNGKYIL